MLSDAIIFKSKELDRFILKNERPPKEEILKLLDYILFNTQRYNFNFEKFDILYSLFRKWYTLINVYFPDSYNKSIDNSSIFYCNINRYDFIEIKRILVKHSNEYIKHKNFDLLTNLVNPYFQLPSNQIKRIDKEFFAKYVTLDILNKAVREFKECNIDKASQLNFEALKSLKQHRHLDNLHLYFYSWAFHNLGNIELVKSNFRIASFYYNDSIRLKEQIDILPQILIYATRIKQLTTKMYLRTSEDYHTDLLSFYLELDNNKDVIKNNQLWYKNIIIDTTFAMARSFFYRGDIDSASRFINISLENGNEVGDKIGLIKGYILKLFFSKNPDNELIEIEKHVETLNSKNKRNPYLAFLLSENNINEWELINGNYSQKIIKVFKRNGIIRENLPLFKQIPHPDFESDLIQESTFRHSTK
jgi:hypothetical protein